MRVTEAREDVGDYFASLGKVWERCKKTDFGTEVVDGCLYVVAIHTQQRQDAGRSYAATAHAIYHLVHSINDRQLPDDQGRRDGCIRNAATHWPDRSVGAALTSKDLSTVT